MTRTFEPWEDRAAFCLLCGAAMESRFAFGAWRKACTRCDFVFFRATATAAVTVVATARSVLLVRRGIEPYRGHWGFPGGFQEYGETLTDTAVRETREETGLSVRLERVLHVGYTEDDPRRRVNVVVFLARPPREFDPAVADGLRAADDATDVQFFSLDELPANIAFTNNRQVLGELITQFPSGDIQ
jgi:ADP-ribose pyrophosphatase YjhB (NUDIX family)